MRAISAISIDGRMVVPHVASPTGLPPDYHRSPPLHGSEQSSRSMRTDLTRSPMRCREYCCRRAQLPRRIFPESISRVRRDRRRLFRLRFGRLHQSNEALNQNGWFVGFTPRRNPDIIVAVLFEGGEHGKLAARLATQVIKAYVDKQRRQPTKVASGTGKVDVGAVWNGALERMMTFTEDISIWMCRRRGAAGDGSAWVGVEGVLPACLGGRPALRQWNTTGTVGRSELVRGE